MVHHYASYFNTFSEKGRNPMNSNGNHEIIPVKSDTFSLLFDSSDLLCCRRSIYRVMIASTAGGRNNRSIVSPDYNREKCIYCSRFGAGGAEENAHDVTKNKCT